MLKIQKIVFRKYDDKVNVTKRDTTHILSPFLPSLPRSSLFAYLLLNDLASLRLLNRLIYSNYTFIIRETDRVADNSVFA